MTAAPSAVVTSPVASPLQGWPAYDRGFVDLSVTENTQVEVVVSDFSEFFRMTYVSVFQHVAWITGDRERAAEISQEAFVKLYLKWNKVSKLERPDAWVRKVAIRLGVKTKARESMQIPTDEFRDSTAPETDAQLKLDVEWAVAQLAPAQRAAVLLYYFDDQPVEQVAKVLHCRTSTAKAHLFKARQNLAMHLSTKGYSSASA